MRGDAPQLAAAFVAALLVSTIIGAVLAWWLHRRTRLSAWNVYLGWVMTVPAAVAMLASGNLRAAAASMILLAASVAAATAAHRWRLSASARAGNYDSTSGAG